jgi:photosystem II oxygen-evolving enhancer protein 2
MHSPSLSSLALLALTLTESASAWSFSSPEKTFSRRQVFQSAAAAAAAAAVTLSPTVANAGGAGENEPRIITRMGGLLEPYQDSPRGLRVMAPSGWNKFEGDVGAYDIKWQDLVDPLENIKITSTPVKSTIESVEALGDVQKLGESLAAKRGASLLSATERLTEGVLFYTFDFSFADGTHQLLMLCINRGKLWSVDAVGKEKRWGKREELYKNVLGSFVPKLNP